LLAAAAVALLIAPAQTHQQKYIPGIVQKTQTFLRSLKLSRAESMHFAMFLASLDAKTMLFAVLCCLQNPYLYSFSEPP